MEINKESESFDGYGGFMNTYKRNAAHDLFFL